jgi:hypothetical protein
MNCTLCSGTSLTPLIIKGDTRQYFKCNTCFLIFADPKFHPTLEEERSRYLYHNNGIEQPGYVNFLGKVIQPSLKFLTNNMIGLDYGCGPTPTLSKILAQHGIQCYDFDPIFQAEHPLTGYDFIFSTECFEHFFYPTKDFEKIDSLLKPGGLIGIMTEQWTSEQMFQSWTYKNDRTHVSFYHSKTFDYLCDKFNYEIKYREENRVVILKKNI